MSNVVDLAPFDATAFRHSLQGVLDEFVHDKAAALAELGVEIEPLLEQAAAAVTGGKRFRAAFCYWGHLAISDQPEQVPTGLWRACAGLEVLHASALVHDDLMDDSDSRRGRPAAHVALADVHQRAGWVSDQNAYGAAGAILLGDLLQGWAEELLRNCGLPGVLAGLDLFDRCRNEVIAGQFLDVTVQARGFADVDAAMRVLRYKSAKYSIERPLQIGAALTANASEKQLTELSSFGLPLGEAFQLRDDLLGVYGDPTVTGKPAGDDLVEGKRTVLVALALDAAPRADAELLNSALGSALDPDQVQQLQQIILRSGAKEQVETVIDQLLSHALRALDRADLGAAAKSALGQLAQAAAHRTL